MDTASKPTFTPGCFGSALAFSRTDDMCQACPVRVQCELRSEKAMAAIQALIGAVPATKKRRASNVLSKASQEIFEKLGIKASDIRKALAAGRNPIPVNGRRSFLWNTCELLLQAPRLNMNVTRAMLATILETRCSATPSTADLFARQSVQILSHCGAIEVHNGVISICPEA